MDGGVEGIGPHPLSAPEGELVAPADGINGFGAPPLILSRGEVHTAPLASETSTNDRQLDLPWAVAQVDQGPNTVCVTLVDHSVRCLSGARRSVPVGGAEDAFEVRVGGTSACAILRNFQVRCWGICRYGEAEGRETASCRVLERPRRHSRLLSTPVDLPGHARSIVVFSGGACAALEDNTFACWTLDTRGRPSPAHVIPALTGTWVLTGSEEETCFDNGNGRAVCWLNRDPATRREVAF